jgi:hypothetical protein
MRCTIRLNRGEGHAEQGIDSCRGLVEIDGKVKKSLIRFLVKLADRGLESMRVQLVQ